MPELLFFVELSVLSEQLLKDDKLIVEHAQHRLKRPSRFFVCLDYHLFKGLPSFLNAGEYFWGMIVVEEAVL